MSVTYEYKTERDQIQMFLGEMGDMLAQSSGFVQRQSKFGGNELVQVMTLGCLENGMASLEAFCQVAADLDISISSPGLHYRLNTEAVELLREVCRIWMEQKVERGPAPAILSPFGAVRVIDSSRMSLPSELSGLFPGARHDAIMKVQLAYEYLSGQIEAMTVEGDTSPDQKCRLPQALSQMGDLVLFDLGYFDQNRFAELNESGVYFISRLQSQAGLYELDHPDQKIELLDRLKKLPEHVLSGEQVLCLGHKQKVPVRVVYYRVPPAIAQQRRRKAKQNARQRGQTPSQHHLDWQDWFIFITNVPADILGTEHIATVYRIRWQVEILFKVWKQEMNWGTMRKWRFERVLCQFYARCLALLLFHCLIARYRDVWDAELSWAKALQRFKRKVSSLIDLVRHHFRGIVTFLERLDRDFRHFARKSQRRKSPSTYALLTLIHV